MRGARVGLKAGAWLLASAGAGGGQLGHGAGAGPGGEGELGRPGEMEKWVGGWAKETGFWAWFWVSSLFYFFFLSYFKRTQIKTI